MLQPERRREGIDGQHDKKAAEMDVVATMQVAVLVICSANA